MSTTTIYSMFVCLTFAPGAVEQDHCVPAGNLTYSSLAECQRVVAIEAKPYLAKETTGPDRGRSHLVEFVCMKKTVPAWGPAQ
jgi:hypothetical protein